MLEISFQKGFRTLSLLRFNCSNISITKQYHSINFKCYSNNCNIYSYFIKYNSFYKFIKYVTTIPNQSSQNQGELINLFVNECKTLFIRIRKPTPQMILAVARGCADHLNTALNADDVKSKGRNWFSTWRTRLYDDCLMIAFDFMDRYECASNKLPNETHMQPFISNDDVHYVFEAQLKKVKKDILVNDQASWMMLKDYVSSVVLIMIKHYAKINVNRVQYEADKKTEWRKPILTDLHNLDQHTADVNVMCEGETKVAKEIDIKAFMNW